MFEKYKYHLLLHLIIFVWGFTGILGKVIHLDALYIVWYRILIAIIVLFLYFKFKGFKHISPKKSIAQIIFTGCVVGIHWLTFYYAIQWSTASLGILCLSTATLHVSWLEPLLMKRKFSWIEFGLGLLIVGGIYFIASDFDYHKWQAILLGLLSAFCAALFSVMNAKIAQKVSSQTMTFYEMIAAFSLVSICILLFDGIKLTKFEMGLSDALWLLFLGVLCTALAFLLTIEVVKKLGAFTVTLSINMEPVYTIFLAIFMLSENKVLNLQFYYGAIFITGIVVLNALIKAKLSSKTLKKSTH